VSFCDIEGGQAGVGVAPGAVLTWGAGNIEADPLFVDPAGPDGLAGTEDDDVHLGAGSPCVDAGDPAFSSTVTQDIDGDLRVLNCRVDIGADESTLIPPGDGDVDGSGDTDLADIPGFVALALGTGSAADPCAADTNGDGVVDGRDVQAFVVALLAG
jgi:hypothetical protein